MEEYREKLKQDNLLIGFGCFVLAMFAFFMAAAESGLIPFPQAAAENSHYQSMWQGFMCGAACGILGLMIAYLVRNTLALRDEKKLKKLYVQENDERQIKIWTAARALSMQIFLIGGLAAGVIAGYFNMTVSITILACVFLHSIMGAACKLYYNRKY